MLVTQGIRRGRPGGLWAGHPDAHPLGGAASNGGAPGTGQRRLSRGPTQQRQGRHHQGSGGVIPHPCQHGSVTTCTGGCHRSLCCSPGGYLSRLRSRKLPQREALSHRNQLRKGLKAGDVGRGSAAQRQGGDEQIQAPAEERPLCRRGRRSAGACSCCWRPPFSAEAARQHWRCRAERCRDSTAAQRARQEPASGSGSSGSDRNSTEELQRRASQVRRCSVGGCWDGERRGRARAQEALAEEGSWQRAALPGTQGAQGACLHQGCPRHHQQARQAYMSRPMTC